MDVSMEYDECVYNLGILPARFLTCLPASA